MKKEEHKLTLTLRIDWSDLDMYEHVNNISIMRYFQSARVQFWERGGWVQSYQDTKIGHILVSTKCDFKKALFYPGNVEIVTCVNFIKNSSFGLQHQLFDGQGQLCAESQDVGVCYDFNKERAMPIPQELRKLMKEYVSPLIEMI